MASAVIEPMAPVPAPQPVPWSFSVRVLFRFWFCYSCLYALPILMDLTPKSDVIFGFYDQAWKAICIWVATNIFHLSGRAVTYFPTGSGDTTLSYVRHFVFLVVSGVVCIVWSVLDRKRSNYRQLYWWLILIVRYALAAVMLSYGFAKVFPTQFQVPDVGRLIEPYGDLSPMGVLWSFMGTSLAYTIFAGSVEALGGVLLLFRRTATVGALLSAGAMLNVFLLNMFYDVPVKLFSFNLLLMAIFLTGPDLRALLNVLLLNRPAQPRNADSVPLHRQYLRRSAIALKVLILGTLVFSVLEQWQQYQRYIVHPKVSKLYGVWNVEKLNENGQDRPPLGTDSSRWWKVAISNTGSMFAVRKMDDSFVRYRAKLDDTGKVLTLSEGNAPFNDNTPGVKYTFAVSQSDAAHMELKSDSLQLTMRRLDPHTYPLLTRGFHWVNELPYNH